MSLLQFRNQQEIAGRSPSAARNCRQQRSEVRRQLPITTSLEFSYDSLGRMTEEEMTVVFGGVSRNLLLYHTYDDAGCLTQTKYRGENDDQNNYSYDALDRLTCVEQTTWTESTRTILD